MAEDNIYKRQNKYVLKIKKTCKRISLYIPKNKEAEIKSIAQKMRDEIEGGIEKDMDKIGRKPGGGTTKF